MSKMSLSSVTVKDLVMMQQNKRPPSISAFIVQLGRLAPLLTEFSLSQIHFSNLVKEDQMTLLRANIPLYLQYVTARYLQAPTGLDQLTWILEGKLFTDSVSEVEELVQISLEQLVRDQHQFLRDHCCKPFCFT